MSITRYWDLTPNERAALTVEQVEALTKVELMENGVLVPRPPTLVPADAPSIPGETFICPQAQNTRYGTQTCSIGFRTMEEFRAFLALRPVFVDDEWQLGVKVAIPIGPDGDHTTVHLLPKHETERLRADLERAKAAKEANDKENARYTDECRASQKALEGMWEDYRGCRMHAESLSRVREVFAEYLELTKGNEAVARAFLAKTKGFDGALIEAAIGPYVVMATVEEARS